MGLGVVSKATRVAKSNQKETYIGFLKEMYIGLWCTVAHIHSFIQKFVKRPFSEATADLSPHARGATHLTYLITVIEESEHAELVQEAV